MRIDFHTHSNLSYDALSSYNQILNECIKKKIDVIAITEHDKINFNLPISHFKRNKVNIINGCEFTASNGSHIIGLFINKKLKKHSSIDKIIKSIKEDDGIVIIPHPFKNKTGFFKCTKNFKKYLNRVDVIEIYNGGVKETKTEINYIKQISKKYNMKIIAGSDSHKPNQIGYYLNEYSKNTNKDIKSRILNENPKILINKSYKKKPRSLNILQKSSIYQILISNINFELKMKFKRFIFNILSYKKKGSRYFYRELK